MSGNIINYLKKKKLLCKKTRPLQHYVDIWDKDNTYKLDEGEASTSSSNALPTSSSIALPTSPHTSTSDCTSFTAMELATTNYVIMKNVLKFCNWQDMKILSLVSKQWSNVVDNVQNRIYAPAEFCLYILKPFNSHMLSELCDDLRTEPLLMLTFLNKEAMVMRFNCNLFPDSPCPCEDEHMMLDYLHAKLCYPTDSLIGVYCECVTYIPRANIQPRVPQDLCSGQGAASIAGLRIPRIPGVSFYQFTHLVKQKYQGQVNKEFYENIFQIMDTEYVKCILFFVSHRFIPLVNIQQAFIEKFVNKLKKKQEGVPFAMGGCMTQGTITENYVFFKSSDFRKISILIFTTKKNDPNQGLGFNAYSQVIPQHIASDSDISASVAKLANSTHLTQHSVALKLSCVGRYDSDELEQTIFKKHFPTTSLVGCFGMGEIGSDYLPVDTNQLGSPDNKRPRIENESQYFHSYSTIFVLMLWGSTT